MSTITTEQQAAIAAKLATMTLPKGLGDEHAACSIAAINLALTGKITDDIPDCMSPVIGRWIIVVQYAMPAEMRNSSEWKRLLPLAAGTGRAHEQERLALIINWMWGTVLPSLQAQADAGGYGSEWAKMCAERTVAAARAAARAAAGAAWAAAEAAEAAAAAAASAPTAAARAVAGAAWAAAEAAARAAADAAAWARARAEAWQQFSPCGLLAQLVEVGND